METNLQALLDISPDAVLVVDDKGQILECNAVLFSVLGYTREEVIGQRVEFLVPSRFRSAHEQHRKDFSGSPRGRSMGTDTKIIGLAKDRRELPVDIKLVPQTYKGEPCTIAVIRDISHIEQLQQQVAQYTAHLEKLTAQLSVKNIELDRVNKLKNQFIGMLAHDLRNPLGAVMEYTRLLLHETKSLGENEKEFLSQLHGMSANMLQIVNELLDINTIESGDIKLEKSSHNPKEILRECIRTATVVAKSKNIDISFRNEMEVPLIDLDGQRIQRVLDNYLSNAIKFSSPGGKVEAWIDVRPSEVEVIVRDNGPGLTEEEQKIVFEPFERAGNRPTAGEGSTGLGLAIVKKFIEAHGGRVGVRSSKHEWSEFYFTLPIK